MSDYYVGPISPRDKRRQTQMDALLAQEGIYRRICRLQDETEGGEEA